MTTKILVLAVSMAAIGCVTTGGSRPARPAGPPNYRDVPLAQILSPAFADQLAGTYVAFDGCFNPPMSVNGDLPKVYQTNFVRPVIFTDQSEGGGKGGGCAGSYSSGVVIPKSKATPIFSFKSGQRVHVKGFTVKGESVGYLGGSSDTLFIEVDEIEPVAAQ